MNAPTPEAQFIQWVWIQGGALGVLLAGGAIAIYALWRQLTAMHDESREDRAKYIDVIVNATTALNETAAVLRELRDEVYSWSTSMTGVEHRPHPQRRL